jgi:glutaredoxin
MLTLLSRAYCHLCDEMRDALTPVAHRHGVRVVEVDVDAHPALEAAFGDRVPVLLLGAPEDGQELCHCRLDAPAVEAALAALA